MKTKVSYKIIAGVIGASAIFGVSGCSASFHAGLSDPEISKSDLEKKALEMLQKENGTAITSISCDGPLSGKVDATQSCTVTESSGTLTPVTVTVTSVEGTTVKFFIGKKGQKPAQ